MHKPAWCGAALGALVGALAAIAITLSNPRYLDSTPLALVVHLLLPAGAGALVAVALRRPKRCRFAPAALIASAIALAAARLIALLAPAAAPPLRLLLIGLDGAAAAETFELAQRGELPELARLMRRGSWGPLRSLEPSASPRIWPSILSGTRPSVHGVLEWTTRQAALRVPRLWDALEARGWSVGLYRMIVTWPPQPLRGFVIPGWLAPSGETWPPRHDWIGVLHTGVLPGRAPRRRLDYLRYGGLALRDGATLSQLHAASRWLLERQLFPLAESQERVRTGMFWTRLDPELFLNLVDQHRPELALYYTDLLDKLSHRFWRAGWSGAADPESMILRRAYRAVDQSLGRILRRAAGPQTLICVVSDHGFRADPTASAPQSLSGTRLIKALELDPRVRALHPFEGVELYVADPSGAADDLLRRTAARLAALRCIETNGPAFRVRLLD
ncbi:MAG TPA: alkaline phosphatase family protein, partial [Acidobacteriota bacterium]